MYDNCKIKAHNASFFFRVSFYFMYYLLPFLTVAIWAGNAIVNKMSIGVIAPGAIAFYRWLFAVLLMTPFLLPSIIKQWRTIKPHCWKLAFLSLLGMVINQSLGYYAAETTSANHIALLMSLVPLISMFLSVPLLGQKLSILAVLGAMISFAGLIYMLSFGHPTHLFDQGIRMGDKLLLIAAAVYALYCVLLKRWQMPLTNWQSVYVQSIFAVIILFPMLVSSPSMAISSKAWPLVLYAAIGSSVLALWMWLISIQRLGADRTAMFMNLMPVIAAFIAWWLLGETLHRYYYLGGGAVLFGVFIAQLKVKIKFSRDLMVEAP